MKFRKKSVVIEAVQYNVPSDFYQKKALLELLDGGSATIYADAIMIRTLEGVMKASPGDWIIKGVKGELYPCKPDIFERTYDLVPDCEPCAAHGRNKDAGCLCPCHKANIESTDLGRKE